MCDHDVKQEDEVKKEEDIAVVLKKKPEDGLGNAEGRYWLLKSQVQMHKGFKMAEGHISEPADAFVVKGQAERKCFEQYVQNHFLRLLIQ